MSLFGVGLFSETIGSNLSKCAHKHTYFHVVQVCQTGGPRVDSGYGPQEYLENCLKNCKPKHLLLQFV